MHVYRPVLEILMQRGVQDPYIFLRPSRRADLPEPSTIEGVAEAVPFLLRAVKDGLRITIFGDYDCDGALSSAVLEATLLRLGAAVDVYLPHRDEGYGLSDSEVHRFSRSGTRVLITIDNGINAAGPVHLAQRLGMSVVIIDHHQVETRARTQAVWSEEFCAAGLAYMVSSALLEQSNVSGDLRIAFLASLSRLAAIASIADCVPLVGATRTLTRLGLAELSRTTHAGLRKLMDLSGIMRARVPSAEEVAFRIGPRLNAAGRVGHPLEVLRMLKARTPEEQSRLVLELDRLNLMRRRLEKEALEELTGMVDTQGQSVLVVYAAHWRKGLAGILASRARERFGVPTFVLVHDPKTGMAVGSGRSVEGISLIDALRTCKTVLHRYGGHRQAAGVTVAVEAVPAFRNALRQYVAEHPAPLEAAPMPSVDLELCAATPSFCEQLRASSRCHTAIRRSVEGCDHAELRRRKGKLHLLPLIRVQGSKERSRGSHYGPRLRANGWLAGALTFHSFQTRVTDSSCYGEHRGEYGCLSHGSLKHPECDTADFLCSMQDDVVR